MPSSLLWALISALKVCKVLTWQHTMQSLWLVGVGVLKSCQYIGASICGFWPCRVVSFCWPLRRISVLGRGAGLVRGCGLFCDLSLFLVHAGVYKRFWTCSSSISLARFTSSDRVRDARGVREISGCELVDTQQDAASRPKGTQ